MTATLSAPDAAATAAALPADLSSRGLDVIRVWDAMLRGARSYVEWHGIESVETQQLARLEIEHAGDFEELIGHISGIVQASAREVVARCPHELALFARNPDELRHVRFGRISCSDAALADWSGPCFVAKASDPDDPDDLSSSYLLLPKAGQSARAAEHEREPPRSGARIDLARLAQFILGVDDIRDAVPYLVELDSP